MRAYRWAGVIAGLRLCAGCAGPESRLPDLPAHEVAAEQRRQQIAQMRDYYAQLARVDNVGFRIRAANSEFCADTAPQIGLHAATVQSLPRRYRSFSHEALQIDWAQATALAVAEGSPAAVAGIKSGDRILTLDNAPLPPDGIARWMADRLKARGGGPVEMMIRRDGADTLHTVRPVMACAIAIQLRTAPDPNAFTDGERIVIQSGILRLTPTDDALAILIGHELAHANLGHLGKRRQNEFAGELGGALIDGGLMLGGVYSGRTFTRHFKAAGARAYSVAFEREADYVGAYYAARAGYDIAGAAEVWRNLAMETPAAIRIGATHPVTPVRFVQMQAVAAEIAEKKRRQLPLTPDLRATDETADARRLGFR